MKTLITLAMMTSVSLAYFNYDISRDQREIRISDFDPATKEELSQFFRNKYRENRNPLMNKTVRDLIFYLC